MPLNIVQKILGAHKVHGDLEAGKAIGISVDEVYTQDATGTMAWLQFEAIGIDKVQVPLAVSYVDHNMMQSNHMNADDHIFLQSAAAKYGAYFSKPGNGICHQVNLERFAAPGKIALGTDSHTPTNGGMGMIAIGVGGLDAATVMAGAPFELKMPKVTLVRLSGKLRKPWVSAMDVILELLRILSVKGGVGKIIEYGGEGVNGLSLTERATITNMGAELGATTSVFPSDKNTLKFLTAQGRDTDWIELKADDGASYDETIDIDLSKLEPMIAQPHSPDNVVKVKELVELTVNQVCIGSCTNSSYQGLATVAAILKDKTIATHVNLLINPGSKQVYEMLSKTDSLSSMIGAGARILESSCGPCIGMGGAPGTGHVSIRTYNRNFRGRSGNKEAGVYLASPVSCALFALRGKIVDPLKEKLELSAIEEPEKYLLNDNLLIAPEKDIKNIEIKKGPNIKEVPVGGVLEDELTPTVLIKLGNNITTDDIMPAGAKVLPYRSNIPAMSDFVFLELDNEFPKNALDVKSSGGGAIVAGENYGQGSSREHAALAPMYLGIKVVITKSFARIHRANLINFGILPMLLKNHDDLEKIQKADKLKVKNLKESLQRNQQYKVEIDTRGTSFDCYTDLNDKEKDVILKGGLLSYTRQRMQ